MDSERPRISTPKKPPARIYTWGLLASPTPPQGRGVLLGNELHGLHDKRNVLGLVRSVKPRPGVAVGAFTLVRPPGLIATCRGGQGEAEDAFNLGKTQRNDRLYPSAEAEVRPAPDRPESSTGPTTGPTGCLPSGVRTL